MNCERSLCTLGCILFRHGAGQGVDVINDVEVVVDILVTSWTTTVQVIACSSLNRPLGPPALEIVMSLGK